MNLFEAERTFTKEGGVVRTLCLLHLILLAVLTGCTVPGFAGSKKTAPQPVANQTSWTDKVTAPFKSLAPKKKPAAVADVSKTDPISLGFASGPTTPALYVSMAQMSDQGGNSAHARAMYQKALSLDPKNLDALLGLARLEDREGNLPAALQVYQQAVNLHPQDARALNDLALCHARCGELQKSYQLLDQAVRINPEKQLYRNNIAKVLIELNQVDQAVGHMTAVCQPDVANYNMAVMLTQRGRKAEAVSFLQIALAANPQMSAASTLLASLTGTALAAQSAVAAAPVLNSPITVSAPLNTPAVPNDDITPTPYVPGENMAVSYPSTGAPPVIPQPQSVPAETARVPVGYEPNVLPPIR